MIIHAQSNHWTKSYWKPDSELRRGNREFMELQHQTKDKYCFVKLTLQCRIQYFLDKGVGTPTPKFSTKTFYLTRFLTKTKMKIKEIGPREVEHP